MRPFHAILPALLLAGSCSLFAGDYESLLKTVKTTWPDRKEAVVACDLALSRFAVTDLLDAARKAGISLRAINVASEKDVDTAKGLISNMHPDFVVLVDTDPILGTQGKSTKSFITNALNNSVPSVGTNADFLKVGGALAIGPKTAGKVIANGKITKALRLKVPEGSTIQ